MYPYPFTCVPICTSAVSIAVATCRYVYSKPGWTRQRHVSISNKYQIL